MTNSGRVQTGFIWNLPMKCEFHEIDKSNQLLMVGMSFGLWRQSSLVQIMDEKYTYLYLVRTS